jgi:hypothetical protein
LNTRTVNYVGVYIPGNPVEVQAAANWNLIGRGVTASPPVLSPNSTVLPPSPLSAVIPAKKKSFAHFENVISIFYFF